MDTLGTLIATLKATLRPHRAWSVSKDRWLDYLDADLGDRFISSLDAAALVSWALTSKRSPLCRRYMLATLSGVLRTGRMLWGLPTNPSTVTDAVARLELYNILPLPNVRDRRVTDDELDAIRRNWRSRIPTITLDVLVHTAMRSGELSRIDWRDIDLERRLATIRNRKNGRTDTIPLLGRTPELLSPIARGSGRVFPHSQASLSCAFRRSAAAAGIHDIRLHDLRHEGISRLFERGWTIPQVAAVSGHRSWENLKRYTHVTPQALLELENAA